jgi:hypothetical protein
MSQFRRNICLVLEHPVEHTALNGIASGNVLVFIILNVKASVRVKNDKIFEKNVKRLINFR